MNVFVRLLHYGSQVGHALFDSRPPRDRTVILLASFPRSGNTWVRFILANYIRQLTRGPEVDFHTLPLYVPDPPYHSPKGVLVPKNLPLFLKTHSPYHPRIGKTKSILIVRNPEVTLAAFYRYLHGEVGKRLLSRKAFVRHWRLGAPAWRYYHESWKGRASAIVRYEDLSVDPVGALGRALAQCEIAVEGRVLERAVRLSTRKHMAALRRERGDPCARNKEFEFVRLRPAVDEKIFGADEQAYIEKECGAVAATFGYYKNGACLSQGLE